VSGWMAVVMLAAQAMPPDVVKHAQAGMAAQKEGRYGDAVREFTRVAELAPGLAAAFVNLGNAHMLNGDHAAAVAPLRRSLELNPALIGAAQMLGVALLTSGHAAEAIPHLERTGTTGPLGIALYQAGRLPEAIARLSAALAAQPDDPDLLYYLGRASGQLSKSSYDALQASDPGSARALQLDGETHVALRKLPEAEKAYLAALRLRPATPGVRLLLGEVYATQGEWEKAAAEFKAESRVRPGDAESAYRLGHALLELGRVKEARTELTRAAGLARGMPETLYDLGKAASLDGDAAAAVRHWEELLGVEKQSALALQAYFGLAAMYRKLGQGAKADAALVEYRRLKAPRAP